jgi:RHS repeat-associated protein
MRFPGQVYDAETGLHYNYFRDYDPPTGRYTKSDPIGLRGGISVYAYVANHPFDRIDPLGLLAKVTWNCEGTECPSEWMKALEDDIKKQCGEGAAGIKDESLRSCVERRCANGKVTVQCLGAGRGGYWCKADRTDTMPQDPDWINLYYFNRDTNQVNSSNLGDTAIHEWSHSCNWGHVDQGQGVPRPVTNPNPRRRSDQRCLPGLPLGTEL